MTFLEVWVGYAIVGTLIFTVMFAWAVRARQFSDMDRARKIALEADDSMEEPGNRERSPSRMDRCALIGIALITGAMLTYTMWAAFGAR